VNPEYPGQQPGPHVTLTDTPPGLVTLCHRKAGRAVDRESRARCASRAFRDANAAICAGSMPTAGVPGFAPCAGEFQFRANVPHDSDANQPSADLPDPAGFHGTYRGLICLTQPGSATSGSSE
jgi:hypothetical protein